MIVMLMSYLVKMMMVMIWGEGDRDDVDDAGDDDDDDDDCCSC